MPQQTRRIVDSAQPADTCPVCGRALPGFPSMRGFDRLLGSPGQFDVYTCASCGSGSTAPRLTAGELARFYRRGYASHEEASQGVLAKLVNALRRAQMSAILRTPPFSSAISKQCGRALDVGCGRGDLAGALVRRGWRVSGVEPSERAASIARGRGVQIVGSTLETASLDEGDYDLVVLRHSLEHVPDPLGDLRHVRDALRPGGRVVISVPNFASWQRARFAADWFHLDLPRHRVHFTASSLAAALGTAGLTVQVQATSTSVLGLPASLQYAAIHRCLSPAGMWFRLSAALCCVVFPMTWLIDRLGGELDTLHFVARLD